MLNYKGLHEERLREYNDTYELLIEIILGRGMPDVLVDYIAQYLKLYKIDFDRLMPSVLTAQGMFTNVRFHEKDLISAMNPTGRIKRMTCNFGEFDNPDYKFPAPPKKKSNRGRKPKQKKKNIRRTQGSGKHFNSLVTFWVLSRDIRGKFYKVKGFRNGAWEVPGGLREDMTDIIDAVTIAGRAIGECLLTDVKIKEAYSVMRNYKTIVIGDDIRLDINAMYARLVQDAKDKMVDVAGVNEVRYNPERYPGLVIKFSTPIQGNPGKKTTIKIFKSGKINIDGSISPESAHQHYYWLRWYIDKYSDTFVYKYVEVALSDSSSDSDSDGEGGLEAAEMVVNPREVEVALNNDDIVASDS